MCGITESITIRKPLTFLLLFIFDSTARNSRQRHLLYFKPRKKSVAGKNKKSDPINSILGIHAHPPPLKRAMSLLSLACQWLNDLTFSSEQLFLILFTPILIFLSFGYFYYRGRNLDCSTAAVPAIKVLYGSKTGHAKALADSFSAACTHQGIRHTCSSVKKEDPEELSKTTNKNTTTILIIFISTYEDSSPPESAAWFYKWLEDAANDFRVSRDALAHVCFAIFGLGDTAFGEEQFNLVAKNMDTWLESLSAKRLVHVGSGDQQLGTWISLNIFIYRLDRKAIFNAWKEALLPSLLKFQSDGHAVNLAHVPRKVKAILFESTDEEDAGGFEEELLDLEDLSQMNTKTNQENTMPGNGVEGVALFSRTPITLKGKRREGEEEALCLTLITHRR